MRTGSEQAQFPTIAIHPIFVPISDCLGVHVGPVPPGRVTEMEEGRFDYAVVWHDTEGGVPFVAEDPYWNWEAPVYSYGSPEEARRLEPVLGLVPRERLAELLAEGGELLESDPAILSLSQLELPVYTTLDEVLEKLAEHLAALVVYEEDSREQGYGIAYGVVGMVTRADLNKHSLRSQLYPLLAQFEDELARAIAGCCCDHWDWMQHLDDGAKVSVLGNWELAKRNDMQPDEGPLAFAMLPGLLMVAAQSPRLKHAMGDAFQGACRKHRYGITQLRHKIMHVVRPLVIKPADTEEVKETLKVVIELTNQLVQRNRSESGSHAVGAG